MPAAVESELNESPGRDAVALGVEDLYASFSVPRNPDKEKNNDACH